LLHFLETCIRLIAENPENYHAHYQLAILYFKEMNFVETKKNLLRVIEIKPDFKVERINSGLGEIFEMEKDWEKALHHYKIAYRVTLDKMNCLMKIAKCYQKMKNVEGAIKTYEQAIGFNNKVPAPYLK
jgi:tetratricopeptide (TPR) repeat protein